MPISSNVWASIFSLIKPQMVYILHHTEIAPIPNSVFNQNKSFDLKLSIRDRRGMLNKKKKDPLFLIFYRGLMAPLTKELPWACSLSVT